MRLGVGDTFHPTHVGVYFGEPGVEVDDPYFGGEGPRPHRLHPLRRLHGRLPLRRQEHARPQLPLPGRAGRRDRPPRARGHRRACRCAGGGYDGHDAAARRPGCAARRARSPPSRSCSPPACSARCKLLLGPQGGGRAARPLGPPRRRRAHQLRGDPGRAGEDGGLDYSEGIAITSSIHPDAITHIEPVRYPPGSNAMGLLATILVDGGGTVPRQAALPRQGPAPPAASSCGRCRSGAGRSRP